MRRRSAARRGRDTSSGSPARHRCERPSCAAGARGHLRKDRPRGPRWPGTPRRSWRSSRARRSRRSLPGSRAVDEVVCSRPYRRHPPGRSRLGPSACWPSVVIVAVSSLGAVKVQRATADEKTMVGAVATGAPEAREPLGRRIVRRALDPSMLSNPPVAAAFCLLRYFHLIAPLPYWALVLVVMIGGSMAIVSAAVWGDDTKRWHLPVYVFVNMGIITVVAYATGWGPILSIGFIFGSGSAFQLFGARATPSIIRSTSAWMALAQIAIAVGWAPTLIRQPLVHGLAGLSLLGTLLTIALLGRVTAARETVESDLRQSERRFKALVSNAAD